MCLRRDDHFVARFDPELPIRQMQRGHARTNRDARDIFAHKPAKLFFESVILRTMRQDVPVEDFHDCLPLKVRNPRTRKGNGSHHGAHMYSTSVIDEVLCEALHASIMLITSKCDCVTELKSRSSRMAVTNSGIRSPFDAARVARSRRRLGVSGSRSAKTLGPLSSATKVRAV